MILSNVIGFGKYEIYVEVYLLCEKWYVVC